MAAIVKYTFALFALFISFFTLADSQQEINHLLKFVETTNCNYERNGKQHTGQEAKEHIIKKYRYFIDDIESAEDFIRLAATKSTFSGKHYQVHCLNQASQTSKDWLTHELSQFRAINKTSVEK